MGRHRHTREDDAILHDLDADTRTLRLLFVSGEGKLFGVTHQLCPLCGVSMDEEQGRQGTQFLCSLCGMRVSK